MYVYRYACIHHIPLCHFLCACLSDVLVPFQAIEKEVKLFSNKRKEIKRGIKALAKTVSFVNSHTNTFGPRSKMAF